ncbi:MAG TPA: hypothetical protein VMF03_01680 [Steroidobacteraceae bacterium]|nr:hypothetical protein [Steroidobacteraceae bacterium]
MLRHVLHPLCAAVLFTVAGPVLVQAQTPAAGSSAAVPAASGKAHAADASKAAPAPKVTLDLKAPPLSHIYPRQQLQYILAVDTNDTPEQEVSVQGNKYLVPVPRGQFLAIPWALMHPDQAWRIFTPIETP